MIEPVQAEVIERLILILNELKTKKIESSPGFLSNKDSLKNWMNI
jgi:hypothetical protein